MKLHYNNIRISVLTAIKKYAAAICLMCIVAAIFSGCGIYAGTTGKNTQDDEGLPEILIGSDDYSPFNYVDSNGRQAGIDVELATEAFRRMGYKAKFVLIEWENKNQLLESGEIDCLWGCFSMDGRENDYKWAGPYMLSHQAVAVREDSDIYTLKDLEGRVVAVQSTTKPEQMFKENEKYGVSRPGKVISVHKRELIYTFLSKGYVDAIAAHDTSIEYFMRQYNMEYRILDEPLSIVGLGAAFSLNDERGLNRQLSDVLQEMKSDGTIYSIIRKYLGNADGYYIEVDDYEE